MNLSEKHLEDILDYYLLKKIINAECIPSINDVIYCGLVNLKQVSSNLI